MNNPLVSVIMPVYNAEKYLAASILSVLNQTYTNWELFLINDQSTDTSKNIIETYSAADSRIKNWTLEVNAGAAVARNKGIASATGKYIAFLDADDLWNEKKLETQVKFMLDNKYSLSFSSYTIIAAENANNPENDPVKKVITAPPSVTYKQLLKNNSIGCLTAMYDAEQLGKQYMPLIRKRQDYALWLQILRSGITACGIAESLAYYTVTQNSLSEDKWNSFQYNWQVLRKHEKLAFLPACWYFAHQFFYKGLKYISTKYNS